MYRDSRISGARVLSGKEGKGVVLNVSFGALSSVLLFPFEDFFSRLPCGRGTNSSNRIAVSIWLADDAFAACSSGLCL